MANFSAIYSWMTGPIAEFLDLALLFISYRRKLWRQLVFFSAYVVLLIPYDVAGWWISYLPWFYSAAYLYTFWSIQFAFSLLRFFTIAEIARRSLRGYPAVWAFAWRILSFATIVFLLWTAYSAIHYIHHFRRFIAVPGQRFEFMQAILLILLLLLGVYYRVRIPPLYQLILIGLCIYSAIQVANNQILLLNKLSADSIFAYIRRGSFMIPTGIWTYAVWRWGASTTPEPRLIPQTVYDDLSPQVHDRLRDLNDKLANLVDRRPR